MGDPDASQRSPSAVAIIGLACRFPGAPDPDSFWENLSAGRESISFFSESELRQAGVDARLLANPAYVKAGAVLADIERFDAAFFGITPREAEVLDVQQRLFLECAWEALENAGISPDAPDHACGVFAGCGLNTYLLSNLYRNPDVVAALGAYQLMLANDKDYLSTRVAYKLNLRGPAITVQTACSTSLVAVHLACQSILTGECDVAIAGGVSVRVPHREGYLHQDGMILSPDGHCRAFDSNAKGTVGGNGSGVVVLKRLEAAVRAGDQIRAVILGSAVNNDGGLKAGYTAPSVEGQAAAISEALAVAGLGPRDISYIEAHGTGTPVGDPIEVAALRKVFGHRAGKDAWCALGSVKTNIGHLDTAAGVAGLIKTVLALERRQIPASLHFEQAHPGLELAASPFYVNTQVKAWPATALPRRAGVSSFGIGGTNAHVVLEEAPRLESGSTSRRTQLIALSARTATALASMSTNLAGHLRRHPDLDFADVAFTLSTGRKAFPHRRAFICRTSAEAIDALANADADEALCGANDGREPPVAFTFCGQGLQYPNLARGLYASEPLFRDRLDYCAGVLEQHLGDDIRRSLFCDQPSAASADNLARTVLSQPVLFAVQYAMAQLWIHWGTEPRFMLGHSIGEYVAACLSGVFSLDDALALVARRGQLMQQLPAGGMLSVPMAEGQVRQLPTSLSLAAINAPGTSIVSGPLEDLDALQDGLRRTGIRCLRLKTSHAFHSSMMDPIVRAFADHVAEYPRRPPQIPFVSNVTGTWIQREEAQDPEYWARHLRHTVRYLDGVECLLQSEARVLVEVGPSQGLAALCRRLGRGDDRSVVASIRHQKDPTTDTEFLLKAVSQLWMAGGKVDWTRFYTGQVRRKVPLPTYPFERQRCWIEPSAPPESLASADGTDRPATSGADTQPLPRLPDRADWFYVPSWRRSLSARTHRIPPSSGSCWLVFMDECGVAASVIDRLAHDERRVVEVRIGHEFRCVNDRQFFVNPRSRSDHDTLFEQLVRRGDAPDTIVHFWSVDRHEALGVAARLQNAEDRAFFSLLFIAQAVAAHAMAAPMRLFVISNNLHQVAGEDHLCPEKATLLGPVTVIPRERSNISASSIDVVLPPPQSRQEQHFLDQLSSELLSDGLDPIVALRDGHRWVPAFEPVRVDPPADDVPTTNAGATTTPATVRFRTRGVYLITGGIGGIGLTVAEHLAKTVQARLLLTTRSSFPARADWNQWLRAHPDNDRVSRVIRTLLSLEELGSEVLVASGDVTDLDRMRNICRSAAEQFGQIHGVIHAAGIAGGGVIELKTRDAAERVLAPKVAGAVVLEELAREFAFEFLVFCSSLTAVAPEFGQVDYVAANAFLDAYVPYLRAQGLVAVGVNWDTWHTVGMAAETIVPPELAAARNLEVEQGIGPDDAPDLLRRIAASGLSRVVVSTRKLDSRLERTRQRHADVALEVPRTRRSSRHARPALTTPYEPPEDAIQRTIADDWQELLGIAPIGASDSFFELGGHSLLAIQHVSRAAVMFGVPLTLTAFFADPTVTGVAAFVQAHLRTGPNPEEVLSADPRGGRAPATPAADAERLPTSRSVDSANIPLSLWQQQLWVADQLAPGTGRYNEFGVHQIDGPLNVDALERSFNEIVHRHEVLRTSVLVRDGSPYQRVCPAAALPLTLVDLSGLPDGRRQQEARRIADEEAQRPFDLTSGPLIRFVLIRMSADTHWLYLTIHHIVFDGWSGAVFIKELVQLYDAFAGGTPPTLPVLPIQYADFAVWQREWLDGNRSDRQLAYWKQQLAGARPTLNLPYDRRPSATPSVDGRKTNFVLDADLTRRLTTQGQKAGATLFTTLLAAYAALLHRYTGQEDVIIGAPVANRKWKATEQMIGFFVNTLPLRVDLSGAPTFVELLGRVQRAVLESQEHSDVPLDALLASLHTVAGRRGHTIFQLLFTFRNFAPPLQPPRTLRVRQLEYESVPARSELDLYLFETGEQLSGYFVYPVALFDRVSIERMIRRLEILIGQLLDRPHLSIADLPLDKPARLPGWPAIEARHGGAPEPTQHSTRMSLPLVPEE